jgi:hypothetical protein
MVDVVDEEVFIKLIASRTGWIHSVGEGAQLHVNPTPTTHTAPSLLRRTFFPPAALTSPHRNDNNRDQVQRRTSHDLALPLDDARICCTRS